MMLTFSTTTHAVITCLRLVNSAVDVCYLGPSPLAPALVTTKGFLPSNCLPPSQQTSKKIDPRDPDSKVDHHFLADEKRKQPAQGESRKWSRQTRLHAASLFDPQCVPRAFLAWPETLAVGGSIALPSADHLCFQPYSTLTLSIQEHPVSQRKLGNAIRKLQRVPPGTSYRR